MNNFKNFLKEKKDLLIFMGVLILTFVSVITIAAIATNKDDASAGGMDGTTVPDVKPTPTLPTVPNETPKIFTFALPIEGEYVITREYFDLTTDIAVIANAIMVNGNDYLESTGVSYAKKDNSVFDVYSVFPGTVKEVNGDPTALEGMSVTIEHEDGVLSVYSSLSNVLVEVNDKVEISEKIGVSGTAVRDTDAGIHVHLELIVDGNYIDPKTAVGKQTSELTAAVK
jgi:stage II sporulation protein Q